MTPLIVTTFMPAKEGLRMKLKLSTLTLTMLLASTSALAQSDLLGTFAGEAANPTKTAEGASIALPDLEIQKSEKRCKGKYLDRREPDQRMYGYCVEEDREAFADLEAAMSNGGYKDVPDQLMADIVAHSKREWLDRPEYDYEMFKYELDKQAEGYLDAQWELKNGNNTRSQNESCSTKWIEKSELKADWEMVHYCLQKAAKDAPLVAKSDEISVAKADDSSAAKTDDVDLQFLDSSQIEDESVLSGLSACKSHVRANAKDPSSVNWRQAIYAGETGGIYVYMMTVQATNSFGGPTVQTLNCGYRPEDGFLVVREA